MAAPAPSRRTSSTSTRTWTKRLLLRRDVLTRVTRVTGVVKYSRTAARSSGAFGRTSNDAPRKAFSTGTELLT